MIHAVLVPQICDWTTLAITHRLSTIRAADLIQVIARGRIVRRGTHEELLQRRGLSAKLYRQRFVPAATSSEVAEPAIQLERISVP